ncbi:hypothetical protein PFISCL1PPCAC_16256, partial [Pristionchus fissidentatus]
MFGSDIRVELNGEIVERRATCCVFDTIPFGPVTYPLDKLYLQRDVRVGDNMRATVIRRHKNDWKDDHPSKWQVSGIMSNDNRDEEWCEGIVTGFCKPYRYFISFKHGNALYNKQKGSEHLSLGDVVDICVRDTGNETLFEVVQIGKTTRRRKDIDVKDVDGSKTQKTCLMELIIQTADCVKKNTPIIGIAVFQNGKTPYDMKVGQVWDITMMRRRDKRELPSYWIVTGVTNFSPREAVSHEEEKETESKKRAMSDGRSAISSIHPSSTRDSEDDEWTTVIITGSHSNWWLGCCAKAEPINIRAELHRSAGPFVRGAFYRIKYRMAENDRYMAYDMDPVEVHPRDIEVSTDQERGLEFWCYSRIVGVHNSAAFTVHNEVIGDAVLPFSKISEKEMRVGDELETLYYRVKNTTNHTNWMVSNARLSRRKRENREERREIKEEGTTRRYDGGNESVDDERR